MRIAFYTLGCKVNQYESEIMSDLFSNDGFDIVDVDDDADVYVINSCTVTASSDKKTRQVIRRLKSQNPSAIVALTGCFPQAFPTEAEIIPEADVIQGSYNRGAILANVKKALITRSRIVDITPHKSGEQFEPMKTNKITDKNLKQRTRAFIKIEDGCDRYCSYCIIPKARGPIRSKKLSDIKTEVLELVANGYKEIVLVGINLSSYGKELSSIRLVDAIELCCSIDGVERVRLGSLEPELLLDDDLDRMSRQEKFCPQFHLSLQSGSDKTLSRMNRHYTSSEYYDIVTKIRSRFNNSAITTDIMVGFAGETDEEFNESIAFAQKVQFARVHVFSYSIRQGTKAATMPNQLSREQKEKRSHLMIEATAKSAAEFLQSQIGTECEILIETKQSSKSNCNYLENVGMDEYIGYTENYTRAVVNSNRDLCGEIVKAKITAINGDYVIAIE